MKTIKFNHLQEFGTADGAIITMKALITMHGIQYIECYENSNRYRPDELTIIIN